ncbi:epidermal growth factor-like protein 7 [Myxocyprinus asiaticus]|uniref:epidermal growth factor-like protein 7 n=1 Tax=Myxocyprinus asiaticus TaxID=70543 RepID=UPI0022237CE8|nr:epidermal growth factor-like protein 7 [Myxocyprinus asiaticus]XP_051533066.1 epidermal growth factor-like protein 7 [Myxocyprinus asiaticus]
MYTAVLLSSSLFLLHVTCTPQFHSHHGRRVCIGDAWSRHVSYSTETFLQPVHKPYITMCQSQRLCSTYKTIYRVSYRQVSRAVPNVHIYPECCPGWRRMHSHNCNQAVCEQSCVNGGSCVRPNHCACPKGWTGRDCQTDVDECKEGHRCSQKCVNTVGSYRCVCEDGFSLAEDELTCLRIPPPTPTPASPPKADDHSSNRDDGKDLGLVENVTEEVQILKNRVELLEQKLEMVLAPFNTLFHVDSVGGGGDTNSFLSDRTNFLSHSLQQLDRIDSLSEQVGFLEERIGTCACQEN